MHANMIPLSSVLARRGNCSDILPLLAHKVDILLFAKVDIDVAHFESCPNLP